VLPPAVHFHNVSKTYPIYAAPGDRLKELATFNRRRYHRDYWALRDVSFSVANGETFCIIGENGCGKSTVLQLCAGILAPTAGSIKVNGRIAALLELGSGFNLEFTGRDNVYLNAAILGLDSKEMDTRFDEIASFAEIGDFLDQPVKTYSTGMVVRLAFAVAINVSPDVLIVDEALAVGDIYFRQRCLRKIHEMRQRGVTILLVTHSAAEVKALGDRAMWLDRGQVRTIGHPESVVMEYLAAMSAKDNQYQEHQPVLASSSAPAPSADFEPLHHIPNVDRRFGDRRAEILGISITDSDGRFLPSISTGTSIRVRISARANAILKNPIVGVTIRDQLGIDLAGANTQSENHPMPPLNPGDTYTLDFLLQLPTLYSLSLSFSPAIADGTVERHGICDWIDNAIVLPMDRPDGPMFGHLRFPCTIAIHAHHRPTVESIPSQHNHSGAPAQ